MSPALISFLLDDDTRSLCILGYSNPGGGGRCCQHLIFEFRRPGTTVFPNSKCRGGVYWGCDSAEYTFFREKGSLGMYCLYMIQSGLVNLTVLFCLVSQIVAY